MKKELIFSTLIILGAILFLGVVQAQCEDSDGGLNYYIAGHLNGICNTDQGAGCGAFMDTCINSTTLFEFYCNESTGKPGNQDYLCPNGCKDDACIESSATVCKNLFWFDADNKSCGQKEFCGVYMYLGLQTFESKTQCEKAAGNNPMPCPALAPPYCPQGGILIAQGKDERGCDKPVKCGFNFSNGRQVEIKIMPETASQTAIDRLGELGFYTIELKEVGKGEDAKPAYEITAEKQGKMLGLLKVKAKIKAYIDADTGELIKIKKPWWAFLASGLNKK
jgi:hypothetical protein